RCPWPTLTGLISIYKQCSHTNNLTHSDSRDIGAKAALKLIHIMQEHPQGAIRYHNQESEEVNVKLRIRASCGC
ncbi:hypothetical protein, partial [Actinotignum sp. GS-2025b]|uniref:hypothetical protein n=1 Tax=Actinotignum sp. GS-2025b TaxID=3427275 RepID=UPI003F4B7EC4